MPKRIGDQADDLLGTGGDLDEAAARVRCRPCSRSTSSSTTPGAARRFRHVAADDRRRLGASRRSARPDRRGARRKPIIIGSNRFEFGYARRPRPSRRSSSPRPSAPRERRGARLLPLDRRIRRRSAPRHARRADRDRRHLPLPGQCAWRPSWPPRARRSGATNSMLAPNGGKTRHAAEIGYAFGRIAPRAGPVAEALLGELHPDRRSQRRRPGRMAALLRTSGAHMACSRSTASTRAGPLRPRPANLTDAF